MESGVSIPPFGGAVAAYDGDRALTTIFTSDPSVTWELAYRNPDTDGDGDFDLRDVGLVQNCFGRSLAYPPCASFDPDGDGIIQIPDLSSCTGHLTGPLP
jgi:hypothetical protein